MFALSVYAWTPIISAADLAGVETDVKLACAALLGIALIIGGTTLIIRVFR